MITTILIVLVAVVVLIVIIAVLALHFLRADDSDNFDDVDGIPQESRRQRAPAEAPRELVPAAAERRRPRPEPDREHRAAERPLRVVDDRAMRPSDDRPSRAADDRPAGYRDRDTGPRPASRDRRPGQTGGQRPVAASARAAKPAKGPDADAVTAAWDSLSDVDYWAELAADKPQVSPAPPANGSARPNGTPRRGREPSPVARTPLRADSGPMPAAAQQSGPPPAGQLPVRSRSQSGRTAPSARPAEVGQYGSEPTTQSLAALARLGGQQPAAAPRQPGGQRPPTGSRPGASQRPASDPRQAAGRPGGGQRSGQNSLPGAPAAQVSQPNGYARTPVPLDDDPLTSPSFPAINTSDSRSYRTRRAGGAPSGPHSAPHSYPQAPVPMAQAPVANPYGSYVSAPQPTYQDVAPSHLEAGSYGSGYATGQEGDGSWYGGPTTGYLPAGYANGDYANGDQASYNGNGHSSSNGNGYAGSEYPNASYEGHQASPVAPNGYAPQGQYAPQYDQRGYGTPDLAYGPDGYQGYPGYGTGAR